MITVNIIPQNIQPAYNEVITVVSSNNISKERFSYLFDLYNGNTFIGRFSHSPTPEGYGEFDAHRILENYVSYDFNPNSTGYTQTPNSFFDYTIKYGEEYVVYWNNTDDVYISGSCGVYSANQKHYFQVGDKVLWTRTNIALTSNTYYDGVHTVTAVPSPYSIVLDIPFGIATPNGTNAGTLVKFNKEKTIFSGLNYSNTCYVINAVKSFEEFPSWNFSDYDIYPTASATKKLCTTVPVSGLSVRRTDKFWLNFYSTKNIGTNIGWIVTYDSFGNEIGKYATTNPYGNLQNMNDRFAKVAIGPSQLNCFNSTNCYAISGSFPILTDSVKSYEFFFGNLIGTSTVVQYSQKYKFDIDDECKMYSTRRLVFLDKMGSFIGFNFRGANKVSADIKRTTYRKNVGGYAAPTSQYAESSTSTRRANYNPDRQLIGTRSSTRGEWGYNSWDAGESVLNVSVSEKVLCYSDFISEEIGNWLYENLYQSPVVFEQREDGTCVAVILEDMTDLEKLQYDNQTLINYQVKYRYSNINRVQRG